MEQKLYKVKLFVAEKTAKESGRKFKTYYTIIDGKSVNVKFTKDVEKTPKTSCMLYLGQGDGQLALDKNNKQYKIFWIKNIVKSEELEREITDLSQYFEEAKD